MNFWLDLHSLLPSLLPKVQVPRKAVFYHHQGNKKSMNPPKHMRHKPTEPTSPSQLPAFLSSAFADSPWEKVASPPPHQPQCSDMPLFMHIKAKLSSIICCSHQESNEMCAEIQPQWEMLWSQFIYSPWWLDFNLRSYYSDLNVLMVSAEKHLINRSFSWVRKTVFFQCFSTLWCYCFVKKW